MEQLGVWRCWHSEVELVQPVVADVDQQVRVLVKNNMLKEFGQRFVLSRLGSLGQVLNQHDVAEFLQVNQFGGDLLAFELLDLVEQTRRPWILNFDI